MVHCDQVSSVWGRACLTETECWQSGHGPREVSQVESPSREGGGEGSPGLIAR